MNKKITVIPVDKAIYVDGECLSFDFPCDDSIHAIQWNNGQGHIEYRDKKANKRIAGESDYLTYVSDFLGYWEIEKKRQSEQYSSPLNLEEAYSIKFMEILEEANRVKKTLAQRYSIIEQQTWPQQEAGARAILNTIEECKDETAAQILKDESRTQKAIELVEKLAATAGSTKEEFALRIANNADTAYQLGITTLIEQQTFETALKKAKENGSIQEIEAVEVRYSIVADI